MSDVIWIDGKAIFADSTCDRETQTEMVKWSIVQMCLWMLCIFFGVIILSVLVLVILAGMRVI